MTTEERSRAAWIRAHSKHLVIDSDGHIVESQPAAMTYPAEIAGQSAVDRHHAWQSQLVPTPDSQPFFADAADESESSLRRQRRITM